MRVALEAYLKSVGGPEDHNAGVIAAAHALEGKPWQIVHEAGILARCRPVVADRDLVLSRKLRVVAPSNPSVAAVVEKGQVYPQLDRKGRRSRGAFDTPLGMARRLVTTTVGAVRGPPRRGLDPACGTGAFLLAMKEAGVTELFGSDLDPLALTIAQIAVPEATLTCEDALRHGFKVDLVCGNPPFVPPERQDKDMKLRIRRQFPWLKGRFDLVVPFASVAAGRVRSGGAMGLVMPSAVLVQSYGEVLRRRWLERHRVVELTEPLPFPGASVNVSLIVLGIDEAPRPLPVSGIEPRTLLRLPAAPLSTFLRPGDVELAELVRSRSVPLSDLAVVDTGVVAHQPGLGKQALLRDTPEEGAVPYADARDFFQHRHRYLLYRPDKMHRAKRPEMFEQPKIVVQRIRGKGPIKARICREGVYVGHTCTVVSPKDDRLSLEKLLSLIASPLADALTRIERGQRLDLYPKDVGAMPVPTAWFDDPELSLSEAWGLDKDASMRLVEIAGATE